MNLAIETDSRLVIHTYLVSCCNTRGLSTIPKCSQLEAMSDGCRVVSSSTPDGGLLAYREFKSASASNVEPIILLHANPRELTVLRLHFKLLLQATE